MQTHTKVYLDYFGYGIDDIILCERCQKVATQIHHIVYRSKFGGKRKDEQDLVENLMALCFTCHQMAHEGMLGKKELQQIHNEKINGK